MLPDTILLHNAHSIQGSVSLRFRRWQLIPAFARMTMREAVALNIVIPTKAGIYCQRLAMDGFRRASPRTAYRAPDI